ncbi:TetR/AcrR family transcriptional regulator [Myxococcota bacterium]|nr:TetR/AcrR family transcriptional regulator [Myxococcota bacterium]MCZ7618067.1 TetR/AcrR family transcriptional regulator [Myxococcota bacterium]
MPACSRPDRRNRRPRPQRRGPADGSEVGPRRRGRPALPPEQQRQRLLEAARTELRRSDFGSVRVTDVVQAAGMSSRSFYEHFESKEDLLLALIHETGREIVAQLEKIFASVEQPRDRIDHGLAAYLRAFAGTPLDLEKLGEGASGRVQKLLRHYVQEITVRVVRELESLFAEGVIQHAPDPLAVEVLLLGLLGVASRFVAEGRADELVTLQPRLSALLLTVWS